MLDTTSQNHTSKKDEKHIILSVRNLTVEFAAEDGVVHAVNNVSFDLYKGETLGIVGESGSGKSVTSMSLLSLIQDPGKITHGEIIFHSKEYGKIDLLQISKKQMRSLRGDEIAMIFQEPMSSLNPVYTCGNQVMETLLLHDKLSRKEAKNRTIEIFRKVKIPKPELTFNKYPHELSGGQLQRVMIAMALTCKPSILIADEPTTALDVTVQSRILEIMQELRYDQNTSTIFITHDLGVVAEVADRVIVMYKGNVIESGSVWDIYSKPSHPYTKGLIACRPRLELKLKVLPTVTDFMITDTEGFISSISNAKFNSVGEALLNNYQSEEEHRAITLKKLEQKPILEIKNLSTEYISKNGIFGRKTRVTKAVDNVSFEVYPGETLGLVGGSGCGKTTLGKSIIRLIEPSTGEIIFNNQKLRDLSSRQLRAIRKDIQIIFQDPYASLNPRISIGEAIVEPMRVHKLYDNDKERKEKAIELLELVNLSATYFHRYPHEFSGGQRQRICIARALALNPKFIICDESVSALDVSVQAQVLNLLNRLKEKFNLTFIFISHDLAVVKFIADRILVMNKGKIEEINYSEDIYNKPQSEYTKELINSIPKGNLEDIRKAMMRRKIQDQNKNNESKLSA
ncbi:ABC transporter ATP-binding protein [Chondrinema litorale]|uniref:ABC transporter ATP-binding protein n=1 Tax=Chondrinema litorale TaxID=2994555 RepID=UPI002543A3F8|nr:ABC transporter ATP-binding protein [Chondrinema litorale]UZR94679.1 ABC transporter ATP-binding protein [Chondrinema litorale]